MSDHYDQQMLLDYLEGDLSPQQRAQCERLMDQDPRLRSLMHQLQADRDALRAAKLERVPDGVMDRANEHLARHMLIGPRPDQAEAIAAARRHHLGRWLAFSGLAAMLLISAGVVTVMFLDTKQISRTAQRTSGDGALALRERGDVEGETFADHRLVVAEAAPDVEAAAIAKVADIDGSIGVAGSGSASAPAAADTQPPTALTRANVPVAVSEAPAVAAGPAWEPSATSSLRRRAALLRVVSRDVAATDKSVRDWAGANNALLVESTEHELPVASEAVVAPVETARGFVAQTAGSASLQKAEHVAETLRQTEVLLLVPADQVPGLIGHLDVTGPKQPPAEPSAGRALKVKGSRAVLAEHVEAAAEVGGIAGAAADADRRAGPVEGWQMDWAALLAQQLSFGGWSTPHQQAVLLVRIEPADAQPVTERTTITQIDGQAAD